MFTLVTGVRPTKVRFLNRFLRLSDKRLLTILIKKKVEEDQSYGTFLTAQNCVFGVFENDNILSSRSEEGLPAA